MLGLKSHQFWSVCHVRALGMSRTTRFTSLRDAFRLASLADPKRGRLRVQV